MFSSETLINHYKTNFQLQKFHNWTLTELENMIPYEREVYITLLLQHLEEQRERENG